MILPILFVVAAIAILIGLVVFLNNPRSNLNRIYAVFSLSSALWMVSNALTLTSSQLVLPVEMRNTANQLIILYTSMAAISFLLFVEYFNNLEKQMARLNQILFAVSAVINLFIFSKAYSYVEDGKIQPGKFYWVFVLSIACYMFTTAYTLFFSRSARSTSIDPSKKNQLVYLQIGYLLSAIPAFVLGGVISIFSASDITTLSPAFLIFFLLFAGTAIIRHRLFDIRLVVARTLGYALSVGFLMLIFGLIAFIFADRYLFVSTQVTNLQQAFYTGLAIVLAFVFQPIKKFFDRITNSLFYRDAYDPQVLLDGLNKVLVSTIELDSLLYWVSEIIGQTLKADFCMLGIKEVGNSKQRIIGTATKKFKDVDIEVVRSLTPKFNEKVILTDLLEEKHAKLRSILRAYDIAMLVRLTEAPKQKSEGLGYIILGNKKSGNPYSSQDTKILEIIADELVIATQNALRFEEIQNFNTTLQEKVTEATKQLRHSNEKLKQMDETKDDFISMASHQLRTPLTSVKGYVSMVLDGDAGKITAQQRKLLDQAFISSQRMVYLIADLLNVSRLKTGKFVIEAHATNLADTVESELNQLTETAKGRGLKLVYEKPKEFPTLPLDETKVRQVIMNFADNAIYYTPSGGTITVGLKDEPKSIELTVSDNGIGVPKEEQHHLFTKFYRAGNAKKARPDGTGLGLFMAKKVIVAQGGSLIFHSEEGKGSTFGFSFPKDKLKAETPEPKAESKKPADHHTPKSK